MSKTKSVKLIGGPADGYTVDVYSYVETLVVPVIKDLPPLMDENTAIEIIGWDDYGPIFRRNDLSQARYRIQGNEGVYEPPGESE